MHGSERTVKNSQEGSGKSPVQYIQTSTFQGVPIKPLRDGGLTPFRNHLAPFGRSRNLNSNMAMEKQLVGRSTFFLGACRTFSGFGC